MTLSIHRCVSWKQPSSCELAALTIAVISVRVVISPFQRWRLVWALGKDTIGGMVCDGVKSLWLCWYCKIASMSDWIWQGNGGCAGRMQSSCCRVCSWIQISWWLMWWQRCWWLLSARRACRADESLAETAMLSPCQWIKRNRINRGCSCLFILHLDLYNTGLWLAGVCLLCLPCLFSMFACFVFINIKIHFYFNLIYQHGIRRTWMSRLYSFYMTHRNMHCFHCPWAVSITKNCC